MALIICPECGKQVSDRASACPNCGCPISATAEVSNTSVSTQTTPVTVKKSKKPVLIAAIVLVAVIAIAIGVYASMFSPKAKLEQAYAEAVELYNNGQYDEALPKLEALGDFRNSADVQKWCKYGIAKECMASSEWETAVAYLSNLNYKDSEELILDCRYNQGITAMEIFEWETAATYLSNLNYKDSERMLTDCSFMMTLADSVLRRMEITAKEASSFAEIVSTELAYLEPFKTASFYDANLRTQANKYIEGLNIQKESLIYEFYYEYQIEWQEGLVKRCDVLNYLYEHYDFLSNNPDFVGTYITLYPSQKDALNGYHAIENDLSRQYDDETFGYVRQSGNYVILTLKNNTKYTFSSTWEFIYTDKNGVKIKTVPVTVNDIKPGQTYEVRAYNSEAWYNVNWPNYYGDVKLVK